MQRGFQRLANVSLASDIPVMFGVLTTDTIEQAIEVPEQRQAIRDLSALKVLLRWLILLKRLKDNI